MHIENRTNEEGDHDQYKPDSEEKEVSQMTNLPPIHILLVEDAPISRQLLRVLLKDKSYNLKLSEAENGKEALEIFEKEDLDLILMDVQMPKMNGYEATKAIREREKETGAHIQIIAMTANAMEEDRDICLEAGMDDYIAKPINADLLRQKIFERASMVTATQKENVDVTINNTNINMVFDRDSLFCNIPNQEGIIQNIITEFFKIFAPSLGEILDAINNNNGGALEFTAHKLKGYLINLYAQNATNAAHELEIIGNGGDLARARAVYNKLVSEIERLKPELQLLFDELNTSKG